MQLGIQLSRKAWIFIGTGAAVVLIGVASFLTWQSNQFRFTGMYPSAGRVPQTVKVYFNFSKDLQPDTKAQMEPTEEGKFSIEGKSIVFTPKSVMNTGEKRVIITSPKSTTGEQLEDITVTFNVEYVPYNQLTPEQQKDEVDRTSNSSQNEFPIINSFLPYQSLDYNIGYELPATEGYPLTLVISTNITPGNDWNYYYQRLEQARKDALALITSKGYKLEDYNIEYEDEYLMQYTQNVDPHDSD